MSPHLLSNSRGFTLIELLVSISIVGVVISTILLNQSTYTDTARLTGEADELSSEVSQAQAYGIAVKERTPGTSDFSVAYGVSISLLSTGSNSSYIVFVDRNGNGIYDGDWSCPTDGSSECLEKVSLANGDTFDSLCDIRTTGSLACTNVRRLDVTFLRPNTQASLIFFDESGHQYSPPNVAGEQIALKSLSGLMRYVGIYLSGQVSVTNQSL